MWHKNEILMKRKYFYCVAQNQKVNYNNCNPFFEYYLKYLNYNKIRDGKQMGAGKHFYWDHILLTIGIYNE